LLNTFAAQIRGIFPFFLPPQLCAGVLSGYAVILPVERRAKLTPLAGWSAS